MAGVARRQRWFRALAIWTLAVVTYVVLVSTVLPRLAESGYAGEVIRRNTLEDVDATPLFYTESERTWEIMRTFPNP